MRKYEGQENVLYEEKGQEKYYAYYRCDAWKMVDSMRLQGIFDESKLKQVIIEDLEMDEKSTEEILNLRANEINGRIDFVYVEEIILNERCC